MILIYLNFYKTYPFTQSEFKYFNYKWIFLWITIYSLIIEFTSIGIDFLCNIYLQIRPITIMNFFILLKCHQWCIFFGIIFFPNTMRFNKSTRKLHSTRQVLTFSMRTVLTRFMMSGKNIITYKYLKTLTIRTKWILFFINPRQRRIRPKFKYTPIKRRVMTNKINTKTYYDQKQRRSLLKIKYEVIIFV